MDNCQRSFFITWKKQLSTQKLLRKFLSKPGTTSHPDNASKIFNQEKLFPPNPRRFKIVPLNLNFFLSSIFSNVSQIFSPSTRQQLNWENVCDVWENHKENWRRTNFEILEKREVRNELFRTEGKVFHKLSWRREALNLKTSKKGVFSVLESYHYSSTGWRGPAAPAVGRERRRTCPRTDFPAARGRRARWFAVAGRLPGRRRRTDRRCCRTRLAAMQGKDSWHLMAIRLLTAAGEKKCQFWGERSSFAIGKPCIDSSLLLLRPKLAPSSSRQCRCCASRTSPMTRPCRTRS